MLGCVLAGRDDECDAVRNADEDACEEGGEGGGEDAAEEVVKKVKKVVVKMQQKVVVKMLKVVVRGRCDQPECRQPAPILIRPLPADTAPLGHGAHTRHTATGHNMQYPAHTGDRC